MIKRLLSLVFASVALNLFSVSHTIQVDGGTLSFLPATLNANVGDTVIFDVFSIHTATEVSQATWAANGNSPLTGGFNFNSTHVTAGTNWIVLNTPGTIYYVCSPHAMMGMKGTINVSGSSSIKTHSVLAPRFSLFPNPAHNIVSVKVLNPDEERIHVKVVNLIGESIKDFGFYNVAVNSELKLDVESLTKGLYMIAIEGAKESHNLRFNKE